MPNSNVQLLLAPINATSVIQAAPAAQTNTVGLVNMTNHVPIASAPVASAPVASGDMQPQYMRDTPPSQPLSSTTISNRQSGDPVNAKCLFDTTNQVSEWSVRLYMYTRLG